MTRMRHLILLLFCLILFCPDVTEAEVESEYRLDLAHGGRWHDAEKSRENRNDDWLCWASSAANVLAWSGWGEAAGFADEDAIFRYFSRHWSDHPAGSPREAWRWWFTGIQLGRGGAEVVRRGGGFQREVNFPEQKWGHRQGSIFRGVGQNQLKRNPNLLYELPAQGYGVVLQIVRPLDDGGRDSHMITLWGLRRSEEGGIHGILVTDSDDAKDVQRAEQAEDSLKYYPVVLREDGFWWFLYRERQWQILAAYGLLQKSLYLR
jgi:hypothetical protein